MYYDFTGLPVIIENTQFCTILLLRSLGIQYDNIPQPGQQNDSIQQLPDENKANKKDRS